MSCKTEKTHRKSTEVRIRLCDETESGTDAFLVWRIVVALSLVPAFATLYQRLTLPESTRFVASQKLKHEEDATDANLKRIKDEKDLGSKEASVIVESEEDATLDSAVDEETAPPELVAKKKAHFKGEFSIILLRTMCLSWPRLYRLLFGMGACQDPHWYLHVLVLA